MADGAIAIERALGRDAEAAVIDAYVAADGPSALVFRGAAGIGKTTLLHHAIHRAERLGWRVLRASPAAAESHLPFIVVQDLLGGLADDAFDPLPPPQRTAIRVVLQQAEPPPGGIDPRTVSTGLANLLRSLAEAGPLLVALDDVQWLDPASRAALTFALRRVATPGMRWLACVRSPDQEPAPLGLDRPTTVAARVVDVGPLSAGALHHVLRANLGHAFARPALVRIAAWSAGNPLYALELGRALLERRSDGEPDDLVGSLDGQSLERLIGSRIERLPPAVRRTLLVAALAGEVDDDRLESVCRRLGWKPILPADPSGLIGRHGDRIGFTHPLRAAQAIAVASPADRRRVHAALAVDEADGIVRARHLVGSVRGVDRAAAQAAVEAAAVADGRGAPDLALELLSLACRLDGDVPPDVRQAHHFALGDLAFRLGDTGHAVPALLVAAEGPDAPTSARALVRLADLGAVESGTTPASLRRRARALASGDRSLLAEVALWMGGTAHEARRHAAAARRLLGPDGPPHLRARAMASEAVAAMETGRPVAHEALDLAVELEGEAVAPGVARSAAFARAWLLVFDDELALGRAELERLRQRAEQLGDEDSLPTILAQLVHIDLRAGRWSDAQALAHEHLALGERTNQPASIAMAKLELGALASMRGDASAEADLAEAERLGRIHGLPFVVGFVAGRRGNLRLSNGDVEGALEAYRSAREHLVAAGIEEPVMTNWRGEEIEALVRRGRTDAAIALIERLAEATPADRRPVNAALIERGRALVLAASGDLEAASDRAHAAVSMVRLAGQPLELARSLQVAGVIDRRRGKKRVAAATLQEALDTLVDLGARPWAEQVREDLRRVGLRPRAPTHLTDTERTVARLVAAGHTNREVAELAFVSPRTVEGILARAYAKLGVRSRAEIGRALSEAGDAD